MDNEKLKENYRIVIVKIIDYLGSQQTQTNVNENIPNIDESMAQPDFINLKKIDGYNLWSFFISSLGVSEVEKIIINKLCKGLQ